MTSGWERARDYERKIGSGSRKSQAARQCSPRSNQNLVARKLNGEINAPLLHCSAAYTRMLPDLPGRD